MKKCSKCKIQKPLVEFHRNKRAKDGRKSHCKSCTAQHYEENKEKIIERVARYRAENKEKIAEKNARWYEENKEKRADYMARYYEENKEKIAEQKAQYRAENKEKIAEYFSQYREENKEKRAVCAARYRAKNKAEQPSCVYQIINLINNKVYIGETTRGELRWKDHLARLRGNYHRNKLLQEDFNKYGEEAFEWSILKEFEDEDKNNLLLEEARSIQQHINEGVELYNLALTIEQLKMLTEDK